MTVSVWGGENSIDAQAIALPDGGYDWIYSSHVVNSVADDTSALREMRRVVGSDGVVVLCVGGTVFNYETRLSNAVFGADRQYRVYGMEYAAEIQATLPDSAVLECVAVDPCTASLDAVYFASHNEPLLRQMAQSAAEKNIYCKVSSARQAPVRSSSRPIRASDAAWGELRDEIWAWAKSSRHAHFWLRADDAGTAEPLLVELADFCVVESVPLALAVIPERTDASLRDVVRARTGITLLQHGFDHGNRSSTTLSSEFPDERPLPDALASIERGWEVMRETFGDRALAVFVPPWGRCASEIRGKLPAMGFGGYSGSRSGQDACRRGARSSPEGLLLANGHVAVNRTSSDGDGDPVPEERVLRTLAGLIRSIRADRVDGKEPVGIMTHHWGVDADVRAFLKRLVCESRAAGARWVSAKEIFSV